MGLSHCMKPCRPPCFSMMAVPGRSHIGGQQFELQSGHGAGVSMNMASP
ncbi:Uncharacterised protein [Bordetella pertussis]|nr:Uncharacterised protein [Bordetella pertussis]